HNPRGGPDGGSGGSGGSVILRADPSVSTLYRFRNRPKIIAGNGEDGTRNTGQGARGEDRIVIVPVGTVAWDRTTGELIADLSEPEAEVVVARGGEGGRGNASFTTSTRQAPRICEHGLPGEERTLRLELKLIADVGIIGPPNVGKSSLISRISAKKARVADYPFTTLVPNLGVVDVDGLHQFVAVDIPGLIEGAHAGKGLGDRFLRHVERTSILIHMVDLARLEGEDPIESFHRINAELEAFDRSLAERPQLVVGNKVDLVPEEAVEEERERFAAIGVKLFPISVATSKGIREVVLEAYRLLQEARERGDVGAPAVRRRVYRYRGEAGFRVEKSDDGFVVIGREVEKLVKKLSMESRDAPRYFTERLERMGIMRELRRQGFQPGDPVRIGGVEFELEG
ncbi:GTPase CgtA, partial [Candidatus Acetothermia bacterium]